MLKLLWLFGRPGGVEYGREAAAQHQQPVLRLGGIRAKSLAQ